MTALPADGVITVRHRETGESLLEWPGDTLAGAELPNAVLLYADLHGANLAGADLRGADLCQADLRGAVLDGANLAGADVTLANLAGASFRNAILADARLQAVTLDLSGPARTDFRGAELDPGQPQELEPVGLDLRRRRDAPDRPHARRSLRVRPQRRQPHRGELQLLHGCAAPT